MKQRLDRLFSGEDRSVRVLVVELRGMVVTYVRQETLDPLRQLGYSVVWGVIASIFLAIGSLLEILGVIRLLQTETGTALQGSLSWVPYVGGIIVALIVIGLALYRINRKH